MQSDYISKNDKLLNIINKVDDSDEFEGEILIMLTYDEYPDDTIKIRFKIDAIIDDDRLEIQDQSTYYLDSEGQDNPLDYSGFQELYDILDIIGGMCQTDYSGYPDCRKETILSMEKTLNLGMEKEFNLITPLMDINKSQTWQIAYSLYGFNILEIIIEESHTCYMGDRENRHIWGYGCDNCPACALRKKGWLAFLANNLELKERYNVRG